MQALLGLVFTRQRVSNSSVLKQTAGSVRKLDRNILDKQKHFILGLDANN